MKLLNYQIPHAEQLKECLKANKCVLDASDTGTGKTYVSISLCRDLELEPFIICPKSVIPNWVSVARKFNVKLFGISNYESIKNAKYWTENYEKVECPYMFENPDHTYEFVLPPNVVVIFDEAHRCKNYKSDTSRLLRSIAKSKNKILLLSATITDKLNCFKPFGEVFGFYSDSSEYTKWMNKLKKVTKNHYSRLKYSDKQIVLDIINRKIFPIYGSRMRIKDLGDMFPHNQIYVQSYLCSNKDRIQELYNQIELELESKSPNFLSKLTMLRMKIEMFKMEIFEDVISEALDSNYSVAVFVNYVDSLNHLAKAFNTTCIIMGNQTSEQRQNSIDRFQSNESNIIISITQAGGVGVSLHDIHGNHPRMSIISPAWSGQDMVQVLGRIHRAGSQTPAIQKIIYCDQTCENRICDVMQSKISNITALNDRDFEGFVMDSEYFNVEDVVDVVDDVVEDIELDIEIDTEIDVKPKKRYVKAYKKPQKD